MRSILQLLIVVLVAVFATAQKADSCEACTAFITTIKEKSTGFKDLVEIENVISQQCSRPGSEKLCYYLDPIKREVSQPLRNGVPPSVICQRLKKKSAEICAAPTVKTALKVDANTDLKSWKISQLKTYMADNNVVCNDCLEKNDYIAAIKSSLKKKSEL